MKIRHPIPAGILAGLGIVALICSYFLTVGYVSISQQVEYKSRINCTYNVCTYLWVHAWDPHIEKAFFEYGIKKSEIEEVKAQQMEQIMPYKERLKAALKFKCK